jgi:hypothetical protein
VAFFAGVQITVMGLLGEYLVRIYAQVNHRPEYIIAEEWESPLRSARGASPPALEAAGREGDSA